ncbi:MAG: Ni/Fe hydrogenase subunit alpha [Ignavibacteria bacterium]|nr:Ni/Fe hydrogenase subunit alpha [Ignavibacteria bacterium]
MSRTITIDPITRIEGHSRITIHLDDEGKVSEARFHVTQFRGFEKFCEGRPFYEMPSLMARTCGICPVSHLVAGAKACDDILAVRVPETAEKLRRIMNLSQIIQSHALSFFYLSSPDIVMGLDSSVEERNLAGLVKTNPDLAKNGILLRKFGQKIIELLGGKRIHPSWVIAGGVSAPLTEEQRKAILDTIPDAMKAITWTLDTVKPLFENFREEMRTFGNFPSLFMGLVNEHNELEHYNGKLRIVDSVGNIIADKLDPQKYYEYIEERVEPWTFMKFPYYKPLGPVEGSYRVGPLARMNIIDRCGTPLADQEWAEFRDLERGAVLSSFHYHFARLIEILYGIEKIKLLLEDENILSTHCRAFAEPNNFEGVGVSEAPRGTLMHHYKINEQGLITWANMIIATGHNNMAMNKGILQAAKHFIKHDKLDEGMTNRVEAVIRCYDPCLSCSTHAVGKMPMKIQLVNSDGGIVDELIKN